MPDRIGSDDVGQPTSIRLDDDLEAAARREADAIGTSYSDFVRTSVKLRVAWLQAVRVAQAGMDPETMKDPDALLRALQRAASR